MLSIKTPDVLPQFDGYKNLKSGYVRIQFWAVLGSWAAEIYVWLAIDLFFIGRSIVLRYSRAQKSKCLMLKIEGGYIKKWKL